MGCSCVFIVHFEKGVAIFAASGLTFEKQKKITHNRDFAFPFSAFTSGMNAFSGNFAHTGLKKLRSR